MAVLAALRRQSATHDPYSQPSDLATGAIDRAGTPAADDRVSDTGARHRDGYSASTSAYKRASTVTNVEMGARQYVPVLGRPVR